MSIENGKRLIEQLIRKVAQERPREAAIIGREALALIRRRVQNEGEDHKGRKFGKYSKAVVPVWFFDDIHNSLGAGARLRTKGYFVSYEDARQANNLQTQFVDMTFSGAMWKELIPEIEKNTNTETTVVIKSRTRSGQKKVNFNSKRYGDILRVTEKEENMLDLANKRRLIKAIQKVFR